MGLGQIVAPGFHSAVLPREMNGVEEKEEAWLDSWNRVAAVTQN